jgi:predicted CoA-binding protein
MRKTVAVIGASSNREKFGNKAVRAFQRQGYTVIPITPREQIVEGLRAFASILDVPDPIDVATLYVSPDVGLRVIDEIAEKQVPEVWINPGAESKELLHKARELGLRPIVACSISAIGEVPGWY